MIRYYCSGYDVKDAFGHGLADMLKTELKDTKSIIYIPAGEERVEKVANKFIPSFESSFERNGIHFENTISKETDEKKQLEERKKIIITPCSDEYPEFHIEDGLNLDGISIFPHNNTTEDEYPEVLDIGGEIYRKEDNIKVAQEYGEFYLLQDNMNDDMSFDVSIIKSTNGNLEYYTENNGKIWLATSEGIELFVPELSKRIKR